MVAPRTLGGFAAALALAAALYLRAGLVAPGLADEPSQAAPGQLLIASPEMGDPRFAHSVVLMIHHTGEGAFGIVVNMPVEEKDVAELLKAIGADAEGAKGKIAIFAGGPVEPQIGFLVHSADYQRQETVKIDGRVAITSSPDALKDLGHGKGPKKAFIAFGYAGWGAGQLEHEFAQRAWATTAEDAALVFDMDRDKVWAAAWSRRAIEL